MKNLFLALFAMLFSLHLQAQDITCMNTRPAGMNRFYASLIGKTAALNGDWGLFGGLRAGYNIDKYTSVGLVAHGLIPERLDVSYINRDGRDDLHFGYGGVETMMKYHVSDIVYLGGSLMIGAGRVDYEIADGNDYFFIVEPGASVNFNITDYFGLGYSVSYRRAAGVKYADFTDDSFSGWGMDIAFNFGF